MSAHFFDKRVVMLQFRQSRAEIVLRTADRCIPGAIDAAATLPLINYHPGKTSVALPASLSLLRARRGGEIVEFKAGGINGGKFKDSFEAGLGEVALTRKREK